MLVMSRQEDEVLVIGGLDSGIPEIRIVTVEIRGDKVRLGIEAPREIPAHRLEVYEAIQRERQQNEAQSLVS